MLQAHCKCMSNARLVALLAATLFATVWPAWSAAPDPLSSATVPADTTELRHRPAFKVVTPGKAEMLSAARCGQRLVAVGDHGVVLLSDDQGRTFRQATAVPTRVPLTAVNFVDDHEGWAVGHWGLVLHTRDAGERWSIQRSDTAVDQPLFAVRFVDAQHGFAVGLWSLLLETRDGGAHWMPRTLPAPPGAERADKNLFDILLGAKGEVVLAGEQGLVYRSSDGGASWEAVPTGARGTFWTGAVLRDGSMLLGGLAGQLYRSIDAGHSWRSEPSGTHSSLVGLAELPNGEVVGVGLDGVSIHSTAQGGSFSASQRDDRASFTALVVNAAGRAVRFSSNGVLDER